MSKNKQEIDSQAIYFDIRKLGKSLTGSDIRTEPLSQELKLKLDKKKQGNSKIFIIVFFVVTLIGITVQKISPENTELIYGAFFMSAAVMIIGLYSVMKSKKDLRSGDVLVLENEILGIYEAPNPLKSKIRLRTKSGKQFHLHRAVLPMDINPDSVIGTDFTIYFAPQSYEVISITSQGQPLKGF